LPIPGIRRFSAHIFDKHFYFLPSERRKGIRRIGFDKDFLWVLKVVVTMAAILQMTGSHE
jgi:hypothetical protein